jgi:glycosyltransferase involved in cell wall biosynthesis
MRISFILSGYPWEPNGAFRVVYEYASQLVGKGHEVSVIHVRRLREPNIVPIKGIKRQFRWVLRNIRDSVVHPRVKWQPIDERVKLLFISRATERSVPDGEVVFATAWDTVADVLALPGSKGEKCYLVQSYDTWSGTQDKVDATWRAPLHKVVVARWLYENGRRLGCEDMTYIPNGIDHSRFRVLVPVERRPKRVAVRFSPIAFRGMPEAVAALEIARGKHPDLQAVFFGTMTAPKWIPRWIKYCKNPPQEKLIEEIYNGSSIFLMASWTETFALPAAEAMACGCALVTADCGGVREYAADEVNCLISPPRMPQALAENLIRLLDDDGLRIRFARAGQETLGRFKWSESGNRMDDFISRVSRNEPFSRKCDES